MFGDSYEPNQSFSSPGSLEFTSDVAIKNNGIDHLEGTEAESGSSTEHEVTQALRRLEEQLSLNEDSFKEIDFFSGEQQTTHDSSPQENTMAINNQDVSTTWPAPRDHGQYCDGQSASQGYIEKLVLLIYVLV